MDDRDNNKRVSLRFDEVAVSLYMGILCILVVLVIGFTAYERWSEGLDEGHWLISVWDAWRDVYAESGPLMFPTVVHTVIIAETVRIVMVLGRALAREFDLRRKKRLDAAKDKGREEGRAELASASDEWLRRMCEAEERGDPFDEEPPWRKVKQSSSSHIHRLTAARGPVWLI